MITLTAGSSVYKEHKQYIAHITGRDAKFTFAREFTGTRQGSDSSAYVDEPGLYEVCDIDKKGRKDLSYAAIVPRPDNVPPELAQADPEHGLLRFWVEAAEAVQLAKRLDGGESLADMIAVEVAEAGKCQYRLRAKGEAKRASAAATSDSAVEQCWAILQAFPEREAKKVLKALRDRLTPSRAPVAETVAVAPEAEVEVRLPDEA